jgi:hypothetical protein
MANNFNYYNKNLILLDLQSNVVSNNHKIYNYNGII